MLYSLRNKVKKGWFDARCAQVLRTGPIEPNDDQVLILSAVGNQDVVMYLVAIKSFYSFFRRGRIVLLVPDSCTPGNIDTLKHHVNPLRILRDSDIDMTGCPNSGAWGWERLIAVLNEVSKGSYVIQLDSDTVTFGDVPEVRECVRSNTSFMIGTWSEQELESLQQASERVRDKKSDHVQMEAERNLYRLQDAGTLKYARGQSSFAGFASRSFTPQTLRKFSEQMENLVGQSKWGEWGSESVASNFVVANSPSATILPYPKYATYIPNRNRNYEQSSLIHFEGTNRFREGLYIEKARYMIDRIRRST
jgi:hypothetical protein